MNDMQRDLEQLGEQLWPDAQTLRPPLEGRSGASGRPAHRRGLEVLLTATVAAVLIAGLAAALTFGRQPAPRPAQPAPPKPTAAVAAVTAAQLAAGHWSQLPAAPIPPRWQASVVWTGTEMLVWGGGSEVGAETFLADGAAYNPTTGQWRMLPPGPLSARFGQAAVWDGTELLLWGGFTSPTAVAEDGASYDPATNAWRSLPPAPLSARADALAVWTGASMIILGGGPAVPAGGWDSIHDGAAYDPSTDAWTHIAGPAVPAGHGIRWDGAMQAGNQLLAWSDWATTTPCGANCTLGGGGSDVFAFNEATGAWRLMPPSSGALEGVEQLFWTGSVVIARGGRWCGGCGGGPRPVVTAEYDPLSNRWTSVVADPLAWASESELPSAWTGSALFSFNQSTSALDPVHPLAPGDASAWDPTAGWVRLPSAPLTCGGPALWTGTEVLFYCESISAASVSGPGGLAFVAGK